MPGLVPQRRSRPADDQSDKESDESDESESPNASRRASSKRARLDDDSPSQVRQNHCFTRSTISHVFSGADYSYFRPLKRPYCRTITELHLARMAPPARVHLLVLPHTSLDLL